MLGSVCAGIITYNPSRAKLYGLINAIRLQTEGIIVVDNASSNKGEWLDGLLNDNRVFVIENNENLGVASALNQICDNALEKKMSWVITFDQDSMPCEQMIKKMMTNVSENVAAIGPIIRYVGNEEFCPKVEGKIEEKQWIITSGCLTNLDIWKRVGGFDEKLFIDGVDYDYCIRAGKIGKILLDRSVFIQHELGALQCRRLFNRTIYVTNHTPERKYYLIRNAYYLDHKLGTHKANKELIKNVIKTFLFEGEKKEKMKKMFIGLNDEKKMRGKHDNR